MTTRHLRALWFFGTDSALALTGPLLGLATAPILARALGPSGRGNLATVLALSALAISISNWGQAELVAALLLQRSDQVALRGRVLLQLGLSIVTGAIGALIARAMAVPWPDAIIAMAFVPFLVSTALRQNIATALGLHRRIPRQIAISGILRATGIVFIALVHHLSLAVTIFCTQSAGAISLLALPGTRRVRAESVRRLPLRVMIGPATPVVGFALLTAITLRADVLSLSLWSTKAQTGLYASAVALSEAALSISIIFRTRMQAYLYQEGARRRITRLLVGMLSAGLVGAIVASILAKPIIVTLFGKGFVGAVPMYRVLVFAAVSQMAMDTGQGLLATMGSRRRLLVAAALGAVATIAALIALVPAFGGVGAAYASIIGYGLAGGIAWHSVFQSLSRVTRPADTGVPGNTTLPHSPRHRA